MDDVALKTALLRADVSQEELARRLGRSRGMIAGWVEKRHVPPEWVPLVMDALGGETTTRPMAEFSDDELLDELRARLARQRQSGGGRYMGSGGKRA